MKAARFTLAAILSTWVATGGIYAQSPAPAGSGETGSEFTPAPITGIPIAGDAISVSGSPSSISISLDDVELIDVVRMFSRIASANIIANPEILTARVTVNLDNVEWRPALASILSMHGLALVERPQGSGVFSVIDQPPDAPIPMTVKTIFLKYTTVDEASAVVERMLSPGASLSKFPSRNAMVIRDTEASLGEIMLVLEEIDIQSKQVVVETQFLELNDRAMKQLGIRWDSLAELGINFQAGPFQTARALESRNARMDGYQRRNNIYTYDGRTITTDRYGDPATGSVDFELPSGNVDVTYPGSSLVGIQYPTGGDIGVIKAAPIGGLSIDATDSSQFNYSQGIRDISESVVESSAAILDVGSLNIVLSALKSTDGVSIVSNPKMIVTSGSTNAFFNVGTQEPIIRSETQQGTADNPGTRRTANLDTSINTEFIRGGYLNTGIRLEVVPTVKTDDLIEALIAPTLTRKLANKFVGDDGNSWPELQVKEIRTQFTLQSGQTVAIGGLTDTTDSKKTSKVPLLGDIPIIGKYLFSHTQDVRNQQETIIFVTLTLADPMETRRNEGIPLRSELVHKREIRDQMRRMQLQAELEELQKSARQLEEQFERRQRENQTPAVTPELP